MRPPHWTISRGLTLGLLALSSAAAARIDCMQRGGDALPADAYLVPMSRVAELPALLAQHGRIRLDPAGDYRKATGITLRSGQAIFGTANARIGRVVVAPGTAGAILSGVVPERLEFPPSRLATHDNCFERFGARGVAQEPLVLRNAVVENNLFLDYGQLVVDTAGGGAVRNNRFIRTVVHGHSPALQLTGRDAGSDRNVFLWTNLLSAVGDGIVVRRQAAVNFIGLDAEDWNSRGAATTPAMLTATATGALRAFMAQGGDTKNAPGAFMDLDAARVELTGLRLYRSGEPAIRLRDTVQAFTSILASDSRLRDESSANRLLAFPDWSERVALRGASPLRQQADAPVAAMPWETPVFGAIPDPAGADWRRDLATAPDMTAELQRMIDTQGIARLQPGVFHISAPLRLRRGQGIVGAGAGRTVIIAKSADLDMIVGADQLAQPQPTSFVLVDLTLQGGRNGLRYDARGAGPGAQYVYSLLSHVVFRDLAEAGILIDGIYGWDNNLLDEVTFYRAGAGIQQLPNAAYAGGNTPGANYLDKIVCYRCRFEQLQTGLDLDARRANNLNACINCRFDGNRRAAIRLKHNGSTLVVNSDFIGNGGNPVIQSDQPVGIVASRFVASGNGSLLDGDALCEACTFDAPAGSRATIARAGTRVVLVNSEARGITLGSDVSGLFVDSRIPGLAAARALQLVRGRQTTLLPGTPSPSPALLVDWSH